MSAAHDAFHLILRPYQTMSERLVQTLRTRERSLAGPIIFPIHDRVNISIIIPAYNHCEDTKDCLLSIMRSTTGLS